ncbi:LAMI_0G09186g1_1 [Lachancea mirantina]|uniref:LAMI_0G09186g1_1 n=1 Tax=Lachancea mirantina TaxID=1230905 RepID=A0A1G4KA99_9SACH|nr:LAMI_0G09186g1_1 [Lachancea mirantina]
MALHNYVYLRHKENEPKCHSLIARDHDPKPNMNTFKRSPAAERERQAKKQADQAQSAENTAKTAQTEKPAKECCGKCTGNCSKNKSDTSW